MQTLAQAVAMCAECRKLAVKPACPVAHCSTCGLTGMIIQAGACALAKWTLDPSEIQKAKELKMAAPSYFAVLVPGTSIVLIVNTTNPAMPQTQTLAAAQASVTSQQAGLAALQAAIVAAQALVPAVAK